MTVLNTWLDEVSSDITAKKAALANVDKELTAATAASNDERATHGAARAALSPVLQPPPGRSAPGGRLAEALVLRFRDLEEKVNAAERRRLAAHTERDRLRREIADLEKAVHQLDSVLSPPVAEDAA